MKIVCIGDLLLPPEMMEKGMEGFCRYDEKKFFYFGPKSHEEMRVYIKNMEMTGSRCVPVPDHERDQRCGCHTDTSVSYTL